MADKHILQQIEFDGRNWEIGQFKGGSWGFRQDDSFLPLRITSKYEAELIAKVFSSHDKLVEALKEIAETNGKDEQDVFDEWTEAEAFHKVRKLAQDVLKQVEED